MAAIKTGLLFGSFNPIHIGHIAVAGYMKEFAGMDEIWFIVSPQNPFKHPEQLAGPEERFRMVVLATEEFPYFQVSDIEFGMSLPSFTVNTMQKLVMEFTDRDFYIITGTDNIESMVHWKGGRVLAREFKFLVYPRPGSMLTGMKLFSNAMVMNAPVIDISSSFIRDSIRAGKNMRAFMPAKAWEYLDKNRLYR